MRRLHFLWALILFVSTSSYAYPYYPQSLNGTLMEILYEGVKKENGIFHYAPKNILKTDFMLLSTNRYDILVHFPNHKESLNINHYGDHTKYPEYLKIVSLVDISNEIIYLSGSHIGILKKTLIEDRKTGQWDDDAFYLAAYRQLNKKINLKDVAEIVLLRKKLKERGITVRALEFPAHHTLKQNINHTLMSLKSLDKTETLKINIK